MAWVVNVIKLFFFVTNQQNKKVRVFFSGTFQSLLIFANKVSCRIFNQLATLQSFRTSSGINQSPPKLTTWSQKSRSLYWLPPPQYFRIRFTRSKHSRTFTSKCHLVPKCICMYYRYPESKKPSLFWILDSCNEKVS